MTLEETARLLAERSLLLEDILPEEVETAAMKVMTIVGTRPEIIRLSLVIKLLDQFCRSRVGPHRPELR